LPNDHTIQTRALALPPPFPYTEKKTPETLTVRKKQWWVKATLAVSKSAYDVNYPYPSRRIIKKNSVELVDDTYSHYGDDETDNGGWKDVMEDSDNSQYDLGFVRSHRVLPTVGLGGPKSRRSASLQMDQTVVGHAKKPSLVGKIGAEWKKLTGKMRRGTLIT
jgi:hypothetical protein